MLHRARYVILSLDESLLNPFTSPVGKLLRCRSVLYRSVPSCRLAGRTVWQEVDCRLLYAWLLAWHLRARESTPVRLATSSLLEM
jgi:hypothetical protein